MRWPGDGLEGLCHTMPDLGAIPVPERARSRRVVRLVSTSPGTDLSIELKTGTNKLGRQRVDNHIVLVGPEISRFHAELDVGDEIVLRDLGSSNGTFVNEVRVQGEQLLQAGDRVAFSDQFNFQLLIDIALETPETVTLGHLGADPLPSAATGRRAVRPDREEIAVPRSLRRRSQRLQAVESGELDLHAVAAGGLIPEELPFEPEPPPGPPLPGPPPLLLELDSGADPVPAGTTATARATLKPDDRARERRGGLGSRATSAGEEAAEERAELAIVERERRQLAVLYQVSKRCMAAESLAELDRLLINVLERIVSFDRGFITYQLPTGDWKLVMSPKGDRWDRKTVRKLLRTALKAKAPITPRDPGAEGLLGSPPPGRSDARLLLPLRSRAAAAGAIFLISSAADSFDDYTVDFLSLFADIAALAVVNCARLEVSGRDG